MWYNESIYYQVSTLNFCGAPKTNDNQIVERLKHITSWNNYFQYLGINCLFFNPLFSSSSHGYDTRDFKKVDERLGTNETLKEVIANLHQKDIKVILDGVFNHVGREFWAFQDVKQNRENSNYKDWFLINFYGNSNYDDGFYYEGWEGHYELVKLNLYNPEVINYLMEVVRFWISEFDIDGIRLDVAYSLPNPFLQQLRQCVDEQKPQFFLIGEVLGDQLNQYLETLNSVTNYQAYKGIYSSLNEHNFFEIAHTIKRQQTETARGGQLFNFVDNHDATRISSILKNEKHWYLANALMYTLPGMPCIYYGSEWQSKGYKIPGQPDDDLRPYFENPITNEFTDFISQLNKAYQNNSALQTGAFEEILLTNRQYVFQLKNDQQRIIVAFNNDDQDVHLDFNANCGQGEDLMTNKIHDFGGGSDLKANSFAIWLCEK